MGRRMTATPKPSTLISVAIHIAAIALIVFTSGVLPPKVVLPDHVGLVFPPDLYKYEVHSANAGGGGGERSKLREQLGKLPKLSLRPFVAPAVAVLNTHPILTMEEAILADPSIRIPQLDLPLIGSPTGVPGTHSGGPGGPNGIGGSGPGGIGDGPGPGAGPGDKGGIGGGPRGKGVFVQAKILTQPEPEYSDEARKAKLQGSVILQIEVDERGFPSHITIVQGLGLGLDERAVEAVRKWRFKPATLNGKPIASPARVDVGFRLL